MRNRKKSLFIIIILWNWIVSNWNNTEYTKHLQLQLFNTITRNTVNSMWSKRNTYLLRSNLIPIKLLRAFWHGRPAWLAWLAWSQDQGPRVFKLFQIKYWIRNWTKVQCMCMVLTTRGRARHCICLLNFSAWTTTHVRLRVNDAPRGRGSSMDQSQTPDARCAR